MLYVEVLKKRYNDVGRTFCDAINIGNQTSRVYSWMNRSPTDLRVGNVSAVTRPGLSFPPRTGSPSAQQLVAECCYFNPF